MDPGEYTVVLMPRAVSALLLGMSYQGLGAQVEHTNPAAALRPGGERIFPDGLCLVDDA
ncbi:MAG: metallopeptidase TldD-related protein [Planctomycetota bacterium]